MKAKTMTISTQAVKQRLAQQIIERCEAQGITGKKRTTLGIEMWCGAMMAIEALRAQNQDEYSELSQSLMLAGFFSIQRDGFRAIEKLAKGE